MGRQNRTEPSPVGNQITTTTVTAACPVSLEKEFEVIHRSDESGLQLLDAETEEPFGLFPLTVFTCAELEDFVQNLGSNSYIDLDSTPNEGTADAASRPCSVTPATPEARPNAELLNTPPNSVGFQLIAAPVSPAAVPVLPVPEGPIAWSQVTNNMGVVETASVEQFPTTASVPVEYTNLNCTTHHSQKLYQDFRITQASTAQTSTFNPTAQAEVTTTHEQAPSTTQQRKRLRRDFIQYPSEYVIKGVTFSRDLFAKAYMQPTMVKITKCLFRALFKDEDLSSKTLSGRKNEKSNNYGMEMLDTTILDAISNLAWWIDQNKSSGKSPYDINPDEVSALKPSPEEMKEVRRKAFVETRNEMGRNSRKRRQSDQSDEASSSSSSSQMNKRRNSSLDFK